MKNDIIALYNDLYARESVLGNGKDPLIEEALEYGIEGRVLDVGAGEGLQSILLARSGLEVDALDLSPIGTEKLRRYADQRQLPISITVADVCECQLETQYGAVVACNVLKYVPREQMPTVISKLQQHTLSGGLHLLRVQIESPFWRYRHSETEKLTAFDWELINELYAGWGLMYYEMFEAHVPINGGAPIYLTDQYLDVMIQKS